MTAVAGSSAAVRARQGGLGQFALPGPPCNDAPTLTPAIPADGSFKSGSPERHSLVPPGSTAPRLILSASVTGLTCGRVKGAIVDVWQADGRGTYDTSGFGLRGHERTDAQGQFELTTIVPGAPAGRAPHLGIRIQVAGHPDFWTELFFAGDPHNAHDPRFQEALALHLTGSGPTRHATFAFVLNI